MEKELSDFSGLQLYNGIDVHKPQWSVSIYSNDAHHRTFSQPPHPQALAIFIGCLGLLGLTSFAVERRTKEIGIRKVLGASVSSVILLIIQEFVWLVLVALALATPLTWYLIAQWEQNFTLQAVINPLLFIIAGLAVFGFAWFTISYLSFRAATANPTKALKVD